MSDGIDTFLKGISSLKKDKDEVIPEVYRGTDIRIDSNVTRGIPTRIPELDLAIGRPGLPLGRIVEMYGFEHCGKAEYVFNKVRTPKGWKLMRDLQAGDQVSTPDGGIANITGVFPQGVRSLYTVALKDGRSLPVDGDHLWKVYSPAWNRRGADGYKVLTTKEILAEKNKRSRNFKVYIPLSNPVFCERQELPIPPYVLGALLGNGSFRQEGHIQFTSTNKIIIDELNKYIPLPYRFVHRYGLQYNLASKDNRPNKYIAFLKELDLWGKYSREKHIPSLYLNSSIQHRWELLQGLMDTDGHVDKEGNTNYYTTSKLLAEGVRELVWSLGGKIKITSYNRNVNREYRVNITLKDREKASRVKQGKPRKRNYHPIHEIVSITRTGEGETKCISIDSPEKLYITEDYIVTHNTTAALHVVAQAQRMGGYGLWIDSEHCFDAVWAQRCGVNPDALMVAGADTLEQIFRLIEKSVGNLEEIKEENPVVIVTDSVTAVESELNAEKDLGQNERVGADAKVIKRALRKFNSKVAKLPVVLVFITHAFTNIGGGPFAGSESGGGHGLKFYAAIRINFSRTKNLSEGTGADKEYKGQQVKLKLKKNKIGTTRRMEVVANLSTERGFNLYDGLLEGLIYIGEVEKVNMRTYRVVRSDTTFSKTEWPTFVEEQGGGLDKMYKFFLNTAVEQGHLRSYGS